MFCHNRFASIVKYLDFLTKINSTTTDCAGFFHSTNYILNFFLVKVELCSDFRKGSNP